MPQGAVMSERLKLPAGQFGVKGLLRGVGRVLVGEINFKAMFFKSDDFFVAALGIVMRYVDETRLLQQLYVEGNVGNRHVERFRDFLHGVGIFL